MLLQVDPLLNEDLDDLLTHLGVLANSRDYDRREYAKDQLAKLTKMVEADLLKVGPKGYIHGWIRVVPGAVGDVVHHPEHGQGTVTRRGSRTVGVQFDTGAYHAFEHGGVADDGSGRHFVERPPRVSTRKPRAAGTDAASPAAAPVPVVATAKPTPGEARGIARDMVNADTKADAQRIADGLGGRRLQAVADAFGVRAGGTAKDKREAIVEHAIGYALYSAPDGKDRAAFLADHRARRLKELGFDAPSTKPEEHTPEATEAPRSLPRAEEAPVAAATPAEAPKPKVKPGVPQRATWRGHGNPTEGIYYGYGSKPREYGVAGHPEGIHVTIERGPIGPILTDVATGKKISTGGYAGKFWLAPIHRDEHAPELGSDREAFLADERARRLRDGLDAPSAKPEDAVTVSGEGVRAGERVRPDGDGALAEVPAAGVRRDDRPGDVLPPAGRGDRAAGRGPRGGSGAAGAAGSAVRATGGQHVSGPRGRGVPGAGGDVAAGGGRRDGRVDPPVFRPSGQADLAPATEKARLAANLAALQTLRTIQREDRPATAEEQATLARWSSWGSLPNVFKEPPPDRAYADAQAQLQDQLSPAEFSAARRTVRNAHYTDAGYVSAIWDAMGKLGFNGGEVLEPGSGSGTFMGLAPDGAHVTGVELDPVTAAISHALYPNHDVRTESFAETKTRDGAFDVVVGNVPFANTKLVDPEYNPGRQHNMHNHFIIKSLRMTKPGGTVAVLTSRYTMDSVRPDARKDMAELGDLVGAVRLPSGAHHKAAGTDVVTDLLVFRRREPGTPYAGLPFEDTREVEIDGKPIAINEHFVDRPDMVLGTLGAVHGMRGKDDLTVTGDKDAEPALRAALDRVVADAQARGLTQAEGQSKRPAFASTGRAAMPDGYMQARPDGTFTRLAGGVPQPVKVPSAQADELRHLLRLRDTTLSLVDAEAANADDTDEMKRLREDLNALYDDYAAKYGAVSRFKETRRGGGDDDVEEETVTRQRPPQGGFRKDPFSSVVRGLEDYDPVTGRATKTEVFHHRTTSPRTPRTSADSPADALALSLDQNGQVDLTHIADLLGVDDEQAAREALGTLVYDEPGTGRVVPAAEYLSGNVRDKLDVARMLAAEDPDTYGPNVEALQRVLPPDLTPAEIRVTLGKPWVKPEYVQQFLRETLRDRSLTVERKHGTDWDVKGNKHTRAATTEWGTLERSAVELAEDLLRQRPVKVVTDGKFDPILTEAAQAKAQELGERFEQWAWEDPTRAKDLQDTYNHKFNSLVLRSYPGDDMELPGLSREGFYPFPHRFSAIRRIVNEPSVGLWHEVGAGKTSVMIASAMEQRRLGLVKKPAIVVPNHMLEQMTREFLQRYPQARVLSVGADELKNDKTGEKRRDIIARAATGDWDAVVMTQGAFKRIPVSTDTEKDYLQSEVEPMRRSVARARAEVEQKVRAELPDASDAQVQEAIHKALETDPSVKELEGLVQDAEERVKEHMTKVARDPGLTFEQTGIDYLYMDEAHTYKNLRTSSRVQGMGIPGSQIATDLHMKLHHLRSKYDRVATLATATPIANSVGESFTMMRYLRPDLLRDMGIETFDEFAANFGEVVTRMEVAPTGGLRPHSRFARFNNLPELLKPWLVASDVKTAEDLKGIVKTPDLVERVDVDGHRTRMPETVVVPPSEALKDFVAELVARAGAIRYPPQKGDDNMLAITGEGRAAALDMRMVGRHTDEPGKLDVAADRIASIYRDNANRVYTNKDGNPVGQPGALQLVFSDIGTPKAGKAKPRTGAEESLEDQATSGLAKFDAYDALRNKLVERGIPREKIRFIHDAKSDVEKAELFAAARDGRIAVLVGSTQKMGVGTNVQDRAIALHHLDAPWRPADVQQREGRIVRQNNSNPEVQVIRYVTEQSFDAYIWQAITTKAEFINQIMRGRADVREMEDVGDFALGAAEVTALGTGSRHLIAHSEARTELTRLERALRNHEADQRNLTRQITQAQADIGGSERLVREVDEALPRRTAVTGDAFRMDLGGRGYVERPEAQDRLREILRRVARGDALGDTDATIGSFGGFPLRATVGENGVAVELAGVPGSRFTAARSEINDGDLITRLTNGLAGMEKTRARHVARAEQARQDVAALEARVGRPFKDAEALRAARAHFERVDADLKEELAARGQTVTPDNPVEAAAARQAAATAELGQRLDSGGGFAGIGEVTAWARAHPDLAEEIPSDAGAKWGTLSPGGHLVVMKDGDGGWQITIPRTMSTSKPLAGLRTKTEALEFAAALEGAGIPWNTGVNLKEWRAPDGATAGEVVARLRSQSKKLDPRGAWKEIAAQAEVKRRMPERFREQLLGGTNRYDGLGAGAFTRLKPEDREALLGMLAGTDPNSDLAIARRLRAYGLAPNNYDASRVALAAADRLERDAREANPQPLDSTRERYQKQFAEMEYKATERARIHQILSEADATGDYTAAAAALRALAEELRAERYAYGNDKVISTAFDLARELEHRASVLVPA